MRGVRRVEIVATDLYINMMALDAVDRGIYASLCAIILSSGEPVRQERLHSVCACRRPALRKALETFKRQRLIEITADGRITIEWCQEAADKSRARPPQDEWKQLRAQVFERDDFTCRYCGERGGDLECDHVVPAARGGHASLENLVTACKPCNRRKRDRSPEEWAAMQ